eukprot:1139477-Pelagomonas_calceolata.AAC.11
MEIGGPQITLLASDHPQKRSLYKVSVKYGNLSSTHASVFLSWLCLFTCSSRNPNRNNKVTLHTILVGVAGIIYNDYTIKPLINLGSTRGKAK